MASRLRLRDFRLSDGPRQIGVAQDNIVDCAAAVNAAQERLRYDEVFGDEGPAGSFAEVAISVHHDNPYITCPRGIESLMAIDVCKRPVQLHNQFFEYLEFGTGHMPKSERWSGLVGHWRNRGGFTRNFSPTFSDLCGGPKKIMIIPENVEDCVPNPKTGSVPRVLIQGLCNGVPVVTQDGPNTVQGEFVTVTQPYAITVNSFDPPALTGVQKDVTLGNIQLWQADTVSLTSDIISVMEPTEQTGWYRRYFLDGLPRGCCRTFRCPPSPVTGVTPSPPCPSFTPSNLDFVQVTALARLELVPAVVDTDYLLIQSLEALKLECMAGYMYGMQDEGSKKQAELYHRRAVKILIGQSYLQEGKNNVAANVSLFGDVGWDRQRIGMI